MPDRLLEGTLTSKAHPPEGLASFDVESALESMERDGLAVVDRSPRSWRATATDELRSRAKLEAELRAFAQQTEGLSLEARLVCIEELLTVDREPHDRVQERWINREAAHARADRVEPILYRIEIMLAPVVDEIDDALRVAGHELRAHRPRDSWHDELRSSAAGDSALVWLTHCGLLCAKCIAAALREIETLIRNELRSFSPQERRFLEGLAAAFPRELRAGEWWEAAGAKGEQLSKPARELREKIQKSPLVKYRGEKSERRYRASVTLARIVERAKEGPKKGERKA